MAYERRDVARRRMLLKKAIFSSTGGTGPETPRAPGHVVTGTVLDASPHILVIANEAGAEERFALKETTSAWRGAAVPPASLSPGCRIVLRRHGQRRVAERIWADIGRVTGTIVERTGNMLLVDQGHTRGRGLLVFSDRSSARILVRFPKLEPGYLIDVIGVRRGGAVEGLVPATSQPPYHSDHVPRAALVRGHVPDTISGSASWHEPIDDPPGLAGAAYPALDPSSGCEADAGPCDSAVSCARLPYLSIGSTLVVRNDCSGASGGVQVTACGSAASRFCDRCLTCGMSPRGRIVELTMASFVELGGDLHEGCFKTTIRIGG
ncbi:MAG TPA: hypothetical protein VLW50_02685 [Streptosporangiaceae bacterium]|nr:hypothetical protein [Streptosporangiaceae bacterium]